MGLGCQGGVSRGYPLVFPYGDYPLGNAAHRIYRMLVAGSTDLENWSPAREIAGNGRTRLPLAAAEFAGLPQLLAIGTDQKAYIRAKQQG